MGDYAWVVPNGRIVDPASLRPLPDKGIRRRIDQHWLRCFLRSEVELVQIEAEDATPPTVVESTPAAKLSSEDSE